MTCRSITVPSSLSSMSSNHLLLQLEIVQDGGVLKIFLINAIQIKKTSTILDLDDHMVETMEVSIVDGSWVYPLDHSKKIAGAADHPQTVLYLKCLKTHFLKLMIWKILQ